MLAALVMGEGVNSDEENSAVKTSRDARSPRLQLSILNIEGSRPLIQWFWLTVEVSSLPSGFALQLHFFNDDVMSDGFAHVVDG